MQFTIRNLTLDLALLLLAAAAWFTTDRQAVREFLLSALNMVLGM